MKKCKIINNTGKEVGTIMILKVNNHKVGIAMLIPYVTTVIKEAYKIEIIDENIISDLLNKANLKECDVKC
jgi:hypothetical protein